MHRLWLFVFALPMWHLAGVQAETPVADSLTTTASSKQAVEQLIAYVQTNKGSGTLLVNIATQNFASVPLVSSDVAEARRILANDQLQRIRKDITEEWNSRELQQDQLKMPFFFKTFGTKPVGGWSLYISLHGGGGTPPRVNDQQWQNQKRLYSLKEGIYCAPRAPTDTWNLWHQTHIDPLFDRLIAGMVAMQGVNWNRVYVMGYSAGGDGVYQLAPRMSDRWAAASMMAGHPNETSAVGLRNVPFTLQVGGKDAAYKRNRIAGEWKDKLAKLRNADPDGYEHFVKIYPDKGHWMDREDAVAIEWMSQRVRNPTPKRIVWKQDDVTHLSSYWLGVRNPNRKDRAEITAAVDHQTVTIDSKDTNQVIVYLDDRFIDIDKTITIVANGKTRFDGHATRTIAKLAETLEQRRDPHLSFPAAIVVSLD